MQRFGVFELDVDAGELRRRGVRIHLQEQPLRVLQALVERPGQVVSREALTHRLWPDGIYTDYDRGLNKAVQKLRHALGDSPHISHFIETIPRRGYRFLVPVEAVPAPPLTPLTVEQSLRRWLIRILGPASR